MAGRELSQRNFRRRTGVLRRNRRRGMTDVKPMIGRATQPIGAGEGVVSDIEKQTKKKRKETRKQEI